MIWKYLFMSNSTELATTMFGTMNRATTQLDQEPARGESAGRERGDDRQHERDAQVGQVEEGDRGRAVLGPGLAPAEHESERSDIALAHDRAHDERQGQHDRREEQRRVAQDRRRAPGPGRRHVQRHDEIGRREREEVERRQQRRDESRQQDAERPLVEARHDQQDRRDQAGQAQGRGPVRQEAGPEDRGDPEVGPAVHPGVVVRVLADEVERVCRRRP